MPLKGIRKKAQIILNALDCPDGELSLVLVDDAEMAELNQTYRNRIGPTNVIAFAMREGSFGHLHPHLLGDVVISTETAEREARRDQISLDDCLDRLLVHGILHLLGYDHEKGADQARIMAEKSRDLTALLVDATG